MRKFSMSDSFVLIVAAFCICITLGGFIYQDQTKEIGMSPFIPYQTDVDTFTIGAGETVSRDIGISGALRVTLIVPVLDMCTIELLVSSDNDSTFRQLQYRGTNADSAVAWHLHSGMGNFGIDLTDLLTGFTHFKLSASMMPAVTRTFTYIMKR